MSRVEWVGRVEMAEVAEALGVQSDEVMAVHSDGIVLWTTETFSLGDEATIWRAQLGRDADGLIVVGPKESLGTMGLFREKMRELMDAMKKEDS